MLFAPKYDTMPSQGKSRAANFLHRKLDHRNSTADVCEKDRKGCIIERKGAIKMHQTAIGAFIAACRKEKHLTQAQLAEKLNLTDRAVSKWETGKSMPDASIMLQLCAILGITVNELLCGERIDAERYERTADENLVALKRKEERNRSKNVFLAVLFSGFLLIGMTVCLICDIAIFGEVTWSRIPMASIVFAWGILIPMILWGKRGVTVGLAAYSVLIVPFLFLLSVFLHVRELFFTGAAMAAVSVLWLWMLAAFFVKLGKEKRLAALAAAFLCTIPFVFAVNAILHKLIGTPALDVWDLLAVLVLLILALVCWVGSYTRGKTTKGSSDKDV